MAIADYRAKLDYLKGLVSQYQALILAKFSTVRDRLNAHTAATGNVHDLSANDIGLGNVPNWKPATQKQATEGVSNNAFMSPKRVDDYASENIYAVLEQAFQEAADRL